MNKLLIAALLLAATGPIHADTLDSPPAPIDGAPAADGTDASTSWTDPPPADIADGSGIAIDTPTDPADGGIDSADVPPDDATADFTDSGGDGTDPIDDGGLSDGTTDSTDSGASPGDSADSADGGLVFTGEVDGFQNNPFPDAWPELGGICACFTLAYFTVSDLQIAVAEPFTAAAFSAVPLNTVAAPGSPLTSTANGIPEPSSLALAGLGLAALRPGRRTSKTPGREA